MSSSKKSLRQKLHAEQTQHDPVTDDRIEIPLNAKAPGRSIEEEIQRQIAIQLSKNQSGVSSKPQNKS